MCGPWREAFLLDRLDLKSRLKFMIAYSTLRTEGFWSRILDHGLSFLTRLKFHLRQPRSRFLLYHESNGTRFFWVRSRLILFGVLGDSRGYGHAGVRVSIKPQACYFHLSCSIDFYFAAFHRSEILICENTV